MVNQGDIIWLDFDPQSGTEQKGRRPALVVSNDKYHKITIKRAIVCPITKTDKDYPIHIKLDENNEDMKAKGVVLSDQIKVVDLTTRNYEFIEKAPPEVTQEVVDIVKKLIDIP